MSAKGGRSMKARYWIFAFVLSQLPLSVRAQQEVKVTGRVVDAASKPVAGADVATFWYFPRGKITPSK